jgi:dTDP-4-dehydrorhamnose reductase
MTKVAITGSTGLVGSRILELLKDSFDFIPLTHTEVDITNLESVQNKLQNIEFDIFLHLAAYTNVDGAETDRETARLINVEGTKNTFTVTKNLGKKYLLVSTDFVFDGTQSSYDEDSVPNPIGYYGQTKYEAEQVLNNEGMIVRIAYPYRMQFEPKKDFMRVLKTLLEQGKTIKMVTDSTITPTFIDDIAYGLRHLLDHYSPEIYHLVGSESLSPYEAAQRIASTFALDTSLIQSITYDEYFSGKAKRPQYSKILSKKNTFHKMKGFSEGIKEVKNGLKG